MVHLAGQVGAQQSGLPANPLHLAGHSPQREASAHSTSHLGTQHLKFPENSSHPASQRPAAAASWQRSQITTSEGWGWRWYLAFLRTGRSVVTALVLHVVFPAVLHSSLRSEGFPALPGAAAATVSVPFKSLALNMKNLTLTTITMTRQQDVLTTHLSRTLIVSCSIQARLLAGRWWRRRRRNEALGEVGIPLALYISLAFQSSDS